jgi:putative transposase
MSRKRRSFTKKFKAKVALEAIKGDRTAAQLASEYGVHVTQITKWKKHVLQNISELFAKKVDTDSQDQQKLQDELYKQIGQLKVELDWLKKKTGFDI